MKNKKNKVCGLVFILLTMMEETCKHLMEEKVFLKLKEETQNKILVEFLLFHLHQFNRTLFSWFGERERNELMNGVVVELYEYLTKKSKEDLEEKYTSLAIDNFKNYLDGISLSSILEDFPSLYNKREGEYSQYFDNPKKGKGLSGTLSWEFGKKIAKMMHREWDLAIVAKSQLLGSAFTHFADAMKKLLLEEENLK